jgi:hypothetical protein
MKPVRFTGGDNLTGFALSVHRVLVQNEWEAHWGRCLAQN